MGAAGSMFDSVSNNFLNDRFMLSGFQRSFLEFPRELPGFLLVFISALLWFLPSRRLGALALALAGVGSLLISTVSSTYAVMVVCMFVYSLGQHIFMPIASSVGMDLAREGQAGRRLGQINAIRNAAIILGSFLVFLGFRTFGFTYQITFMLAAGGFFTAALLMLLMTPDRPKKAANFLTLHKEYRLYYILSVLYGSRKQLFITFAPWVIVTIFKQPTQTLATLLTVGGVIGILFQPLLGWMVDHLGERVVLASEAVLLTAVCVGYGFARSVFPEATAFAIVCACYLLDQMLMSVAIARATYIKKIALVPDDVQPALTAGVTIDHIFSIAVALIGGVIWNRFGFQYVFLMGAFIAVANLFAALRVRIPPSTRLRESSLPAD